MKLKELLKILSEYDKQKEVYFIDLNKGNYVIAEPKVMNLKKINPNANCIVIGRIS